MFELPGEWSRKPKEKGVWIQGVEEGTKGGDGKNPIMRLEFQVADVKNPFIAVRRIVRKGNHVACGPEKEDNCILTESTGQKMVLEPK